MEILSEKNSLKCIKHPNEQSTFIKINQINIFDKILYCETCIEEDITFTPLNFLRIKKVLDSNSFLQQWPPLDDSKIQEQILQIQSNVENDKNLENKIIKFFDGFRNEIMLKVDSCQKSMIKLASEISSQNKNILQKFKEISNIDSLKSILLNNNLNEGEKEKQLRQFIQSAINKKEQNKYQIIKFLNENNQQNRQFSFDKSQGKKLEIISLIENMNFFRFNSQNEKQRMDLIKPNNQKNKIEDILPNLNILKSSNKQNQPSEIKILTLQDNQIEINCKSGGDGQRLYSNIILEYNKIYIFKFKIHINSFQDQSLLIGLINDQIKDNSQLFDQGHIYQELEFEKSSLQMLVRKGHFVLKDEIVKDVREVELRIHLSNQTVDIIIPNQSKISLQPKFKQYLRYNNYRLYLYLNEQISVTITSAVICDKFEE